MENGSTGSKKDTEYGVARTEIHILANGKEARQRDMACMSGVMAIDMRVNGGLAYDMETALTFSQTAINISASTGTVIQMDSASINGRMEIHMQESFLMA